MPPRETARSVLRSATADHHERVDRLFSGIDLADRDQYGRFLTAQAAAHLAVEAALTLAGTAAVLPDWPERQRAACLRADLAALGLPVPPAGASPAFADPAAQLGGVYVLEGSRLGGRLLARQVPAAYPRAFLGRTDSGGWPRLLAVLEECLPTAGRRMAAARAAAAVFELFEAGARRFLPAAAAARGAAAITR